LTEALGRWGHACLRLGRWHEVTERLARHADQLLGDDRAARNRLDALLSSGRTDEALDLVVGSGGAVPGGSSAPAQLPCAVHPFVGRADELAFLDGLLAQSGDLAQSGEASGPVIATLVGTAGVGKTALAVHWAHRVADAFPDGVLYADLRGYDPDRPLSPAEVLVGFLGAFGVMGPDVPFELAERAATYRSVLAGRRVLVIVDNAGSADQVRPLLPGVPSCVVIVTSRDSMADLVVRDGAHRVRLDLLPEAEASDLVISLVGARALAEPEALAALVGQCSRLPLALRVAAELAVDRDRDTLAGLVRELTDEGDRFALMGVGGDPWTDVEAVFSWSYRYLEPGTARLFRLLGLHPGPDWGVPAVAALAGVDLGTADRCLDTLARVHLAQRSGRGRYVMHDLLRAYARGLATTLDPDGERRAALIGLFDHAVASAASVLDPSSVRQRPSRPLPVTAVPLPEVADPAAARDWFDVERASLVRLVVHAADSDRPEHAVFLAEILAGHLMRGGHLVDALAVYDAALRAAETVDDLMGQAHALVTSAVVLCQWGRPAEGRERFERAISCARRCGSVQLEARALHNLAMLEEMTGHRDRALDGLHRALSLWRRTDDRMAEAITLNTIGLLEAEQGEYRLALDHLEAVLQAALASGDRRLEAEARDGLGCVLGRVGRHREAVDHLEAAMLIWRECSATDSEAMVKAYLALAYAHCGRDGEALELLQQSLDFHRRSGYREAVAGVLNALGTVHRLAGRLDQAMDSHRQALQEIERLDGTRELERAKAHDGLGQALAALGRLDRAREHWERALALFEQTGDAAAADVRSRLKAPSR